MTTQFDTYNIDNLIKLGFSLNEALIYLACLISGEATILDLSKQTGITRTTIYGVTDDLVAKGVLRFIQKQAHRIFSAEDPKKISLIFDRQKEEAEQKNKWLSEILPSLTMQYNTTSNKPTVSYFQGQNEVRQIFEDVLACKPKEVRFVCETGTLEKAVGDVWLKQYVKRRVQAGISTRGVFAPQNIAGDIIYKPGIKYKRSVRIGPDYLKSPVYTGIYQNKVFHVSSLEESYGVLIESKDLSLSMTGWFQALWEVSKELV